MFRALLLAAPLRLAAPVLLAGAPTRSVSSLRSALAQARPHGRSPPPVPVAPRPAHPPRRADDPGWRLVWNGSPSAGRGQAVVRLRLATASVPPETDATEILPIGTSRDPDIVPGCLQGGVTAKHSLRLPDRMRGGVRFLAGHNAGAGRNQTIAATDLRAIVDGTYTVVERSRMATSAAPPARIFRCHRASPNASLASLRGAQPATPDRTPSARWRRRAGRPRAASYNT